MLARGETENIVGEGVHTLAMVKKYGLIDQLDYPLFELVSSIVEKPQRVKQQIHHYLQTCFD
jgi:glycerol-3-phosphate dehydrogenase